MMVSSILMQELMNLKDIAIIDVREPEECQFGMIPDAQNVPMNQIPDVIQTLPKDQKYYIVCQSGSRSQIVCQYMAQQGYQAVNVMGGMSAYRGRLKYEM